MRVLFTSPGGVGHVFPTVPLARAVRDRGHEVLWALPPQGAANVPDDLPTAALANTSLLGVPDVMARWPEIGELPPADRPDFLFGKLFGALGAPPFLADLTPVARDWKPDLIVADAAELSAHIVAAELGIPSVTRGFGMRLPAIRTERATAEVAPLWEERGLQPRPHCGMYDHLYLDIYPPALSMGGPDDHVARQQLLRPVAYAGSEDGRVTVPPGDAPLVYATMGTVFNDVDVLRAVVAHLAELDARVLVTVGAHGDPAAVDPVVDHVRVERFVPQTTLLPMCDAVVSHGGSGTMLATMSLGIPHLTVPQGADQFLNAGAVANAGAGLTLMPGIYGAAEVRDAVGQLLNDASYRAAAQRVAGSIASMPSPDEVAAVLETIS